ncbi:glycosyltransferase family 39 protein [Echinicola marina]|uniref:ArnT family glycosyltransferase n=1 Tax=Echinicola marina TaxID=2859768 RepID=UPI001CF63F6C|nr:glycosyltransferase family 39 protein [Echinicola marina]UCS91940.1 glycosyltransferase family 39 protein [Echinicola marina]
MLFKSVSHLHIFILSLGFVLVNLVLYTQLGVMEDSDTERYLTYAREIQERGIFFKPHEFWYIVYPLFIILMTSIYNSLGMVVFGQLLLSYTALISVYASAKSLYAQPKAGLWAGIGFVVFFMISYWNFEIYCESLLISLNCLAFYFILRGVRGRGGQQLWGMGSLIILAAVFTKPTGIALLAGVFALLLTLLWHKIKKRTVKYTCLMVGTLTLLLLANKMLSTFTFVRDYQVGEIIYNLEVLPFGAYEKWLKLEVPQDLYLPDASWPPLVQLLVLVLANPLYALQLLGAKLFYYLFYIRPYYSSMHNGYMLLILLPFYIGFVKGIRSNKVPMGIRVMVAVFLLVSILSTILMTIDWRNRFLVAILPWVLIIGSGSLAKIEYAGLFGRIWGKRKG